MMKHNPVLIFVGSQERSETFNTFGGFEVFAAPTMRDALAQTIFSYPDAIVIDSAYDMVLADDVYFHLRTIEHPPLIVLSDMPMRWDTRGRGTVIILPENSSHEAIAETILTALEEDTNLVS